ncbi:ZipA, C-terminal FtsZ-binding domain [Nitrosomonas marina]|uniref:Cell division protein ZipA n=1 Tax=Nitrosomonas marina TaxID=917 RepID=A0A1H9ZSV0_9PROT|nr:cell division protein ZipA C-terminal FtsZ-binding domain-containing protein [Nitrosomonas marina]SES84861.1 ZipA, C-terminal FtsZ-binding domain [Nitrosomonas marina]
MDLLNMSDLQVSLIFIGIVIIVGVAIFNWVQQIRYRRKIESTLDHQHDDALFKKNNDHKQREPHKRIEPELGQGFFSNNPSPPQHSLIDEPDNLSGDNSLQIDSPEIETSSSTETLPTADVYDSRSNYVVIISADEIIPGDELNKLIQRKYEFSKPLIWLGRRQKSSTWEEITAGATAENSNYISLKGCLLLADRSGPIREIDLSKFRDTVQDFASHIRANADCPDIVNAHEQAIVLDKFCADVDVMIGINIISKDNGAFVGTKIRALAEASGFKLEADGIFKYRDENNHVLFTLTNYESDSFKPEKMKTITTHGVTFLLDVPRVANGEKVFDQMTHLAKIFANTLGGIMVDDNRVPLSENGLARSKQQLVNIQASMKENNIVAGGSNALRLFN